MIHYQTVQLGQRNEPEHFNNISADACNVVDNIHPQYLNAHHFGMPYQVAEFKRHYNPYGVPPGYTDTIWYILHHLTSSPTDPGVVVRVKSLPRSHVMNLTMGFIRQDLRRLTNSTGQFTKNIRLNFYIDRTVLATGSYTIEVVAVHYDSAYNPGSPIVLESISTMGYKQIDFTLPEYPNYAFTDLYLKITPAGSGHTGDTKFTVSGFHMRYVQ